MTSTTEPLDQVALYRYAIMNMDLGRLAAMRSMAPTDLDAAVVGFHDEEIARNRTTTAPIRCTASASGRHSNAWWCEHCSEELGSPADREAQRLQMTKGNGA